MTAMLRPRTHHAPNQPQPAIPTALMRLWGIGALVAITLFASFSSAAVSMAAPAPLPKVAPTQVDSTLSSSQANAAQSARQYLQISGFSRSGLINQLEYEGYSTSDAAYAVDSLHINWNKQAVRSAKQYLALTSFSRSGLIDQLEYEGYTASQAAYGANAAY